MLDRILTDDPAVARYRTAAGSLIAILAMWIENRFGIGVVGWLADFAALSVSTVTLILAWVLGQTLYAASQRWTWVDKAIHLGAAKQPAYIDDAASREV